MKSIIDVTINLRKRSKRVYNFSKQPELNIRARLLLLKLNSAIDENISKMNDGQRDIYNILCLNL